MLFQFAFFFFSIAALVVLAADGEQKGDYICICNRDGGSKSVSIINTANDEIIYTLNMSAIPGIDNTVIPMYCSYFENSRGKLMAVGDRGNKALFIFDVADQFALVARLNAGNGIFHHWTSVEADQAWILCDGGTPNPLISTTTATELYVYNLTSFEKIGVVPFPDELYDIAIPSGIFHDLTVSPKGDYAFVTTYNFPGSNDYVIKYSTKTLELIAYTPVGNLAHVTYSDTSLPLYVISQGSLLDSVTVVNPDDMSVITSIPGVSGAHMMAGPALDGKTYYLTNLPGGGVDGLFGFNTRDNTIDYSSVVDTQYSTPHNVALSGDGRKLYCTHSGPQVVTTIWDVANIYNSRPQFLGRIITAQNPYGIWNFQTSVKLSDVISTSSSSFLKISLVSCFVVLALTLFF